MVKETVANVSRQELQRLLDGTVDSLRVSETLDAPDSMPIGELEIDDVVTIVGVVTDIDSVNTFSRDDGSDGQVRNIQIQDRTGVVPVVLWGDEAVRDLSVGDTVQVVDGEVQVDEYDDNDEAKQVNVGYDSTLKVFEQDRRAEIVTLILEDDA